MGRYIIITLLGVFTALNALACSCTGPDKFVHSISELTVEVEVIDVNVVALKVGDRELKYDVTRLKILRTIKGDPSYDTLLLRNDHGFECIHSVPYKEPKRRYILSGYIDANAFMADTTAIPKNLFTLDLCMENILIRMEQKVIGNITKNRWTKRSKFSNRIRKIRWLNNWYQSHFMQKEDKEKIMQKMNEARFYRILKRKDLL